MKATIHKCEWMNPDFSRIARMADEDIDLPIKNRMEFLQKLVRGKIDVYHHQGRDLICNDEGILLGMPLNLWARQQGLTICGTIVEVHGVLK